MRKARPTMGLREAVDEIIGLLQDQPGPQPGGINVWDRIVTHVIEHNSLPDREIKLIEKVIAKAFRGWSHEQRCAIWNKTETGMTDDDEYCDTSYNAIGYVLQNELLDEVTRRAWNEAEAGTKSKSKKRPSSVRPREQEIEEAPIE